MGYMRKELVYKRVGWTREELEFLYREGSITEDFREAVEEYFRKCERAMAEMNKKYPPKGQYRIGGLGMYP
jgi:U3 small nucleolar RNA-associated protein 14